MAQLNLTAYAGQVTGRVLVMMKSNYQKIMAKDAIANPSGAEIIAKAIIQKHQTVGKTKIFVTSAREIYPLTRNFKSFLAPPLETSEISYHIPTPIRPISLGRNYTGKFTYVPVFSQLIGHMTEDHVIRPFSDCLTKRRQPRLKPFLAINMRQ